MANREPIALRDDFDDAAADRWNDGAIDGCRGIAPRSEDADYRQGHAHGCQERKVQVVMPSRPEGYYHAPIGTFE
jgi:hypothetical protein